MAGTIGPPPVYDAKKHQNGVNPFNPVYHYDVKLSVPQRHQPQQQRRKSLTVADIQRRYEIAPHMIENLHKVEPYEIYLIVDDSGSMMGPRWAELKQVVKHVVDVGGALDADGIDIVRMNGYETKNGTRIRHVKNVFRADQVDSFFAEGPSGLTPMSDTLQYVMDIKTAKPKLIVIATDGVPEGSSTSSDSLGRFARLLKTRDAPNNRICILMCTDQLSVVEQYNELDNTVDCLDVLDDFESERVEVRNVQGATFNYSFGDHVMRMLLSPIIPEYDHMDQRKLKFDASGRLLGYASAGVAGCCIIM